MYIRVLVVRQGDQWLAQSVDFSMAAQGPSDSLAVAAFVRIWGAHYRRDMELGRTPFDSLPNPPRRLVEEWERIVKTNSRVISASRGDEMPPAYIIEALALNGSDFNAGQ